MYEAKSTYLNRFGPSNFKHLAGAKIGFVRSSKSAAGLMTDEAQSA